MVVGFTTTRVPTHLGKWEKPVYFIPLTPIRVMPLKTEKNREKPLKFVYRKSLDNIELLSFDHCSFVPLQLRTSEFCGVSLVQ